MAKPPKQESWLDTIVTVVVAVGIALVLRSFAYQPFNIPSSSMVPTLLIGDFLFVSKFSYGYSRYSFPFGVKLWGGRVMAREPKRGDVIVFKLPRDNETDYIKRLIGLPGDRVQMREGRLYINDQLVERRQIEDYVETGPGGRRDRFAQYEETLPGGVRHRILERSDSLPMDDTSVFEVPPGQYFLLGDNRDMSLDSRFSAAEGGVGFVPYINLVGRADLIFFSLEEGTRFFEIWEWPFAIRFDRIFDRIRSEVVPDVAPASGSAR
jgi:signal peptidase I